MQADDDNEEKLQIFKPTSREVVQKSYFTSIGVYTHTCCNVSNHDHCSVRMKHLFHSLSAWLQFLSLLFWNAKIVHRDYATSVLLVWMEEKEQWLTIKLNLKWYEYSEIIMNVLLNWSLSIWKITLWRK